MTVMNGGTVSANFVYDDEGNRVKGMVAGVDTYYVGNYFEWTGESESAGSFPACVPGSPPGHQVQVRRKLPMGTPHGIMNSS